MKLGHRSPAPLRAACGRLVDQRTSRHATGRPIPGSVHGKGIHRIDEIVS